MKALLSRIFKFLSSGELVTDNTIEMASETEGNPSLLVHKCHAQVLDSRKVTWKGQEIPAIYCHVAKNIGASGGWEFFFFWFASSPVIQWSKSLTDFRHAVWTYQPLVDKSYGHSERIDKCSMCRCYHFSLSSWYSNRREDRGEGEWWEWTKRIPSLRICGYERDAEIYTGVKTRRNRPRITNVA